MSSDSGSNSLIQWRVNNGFLFNSDSGGLAEIISSVPKERRIFTCRFWWCPMNQCLLRLMIYPDNPVQLEPSLAGAELIRDNIYAIFDACKKQSEKADILMTAMAAIFPCVIEDITNNRYIITVSINTKPLHLAECSKPEIWITILDRVNSNSVNTKF